MRLTADSVFGLSVPPGKSDHIEWDDDLPGFGVRFRGDHKSWVVQYRVGTQQRRESLGDVRKVKIGDARKIAQQRFASAELGRDPAAERAQAKAATKAVKLTFQVVAERYLAAKGDVQRARTHGQAKLHLLGPHWKPLAGRPVEVITRAEIASRLQEIVVEHGRTAAARARGNLSALFGWAMREGLSAIRPSRPTTRPRACSRASGC